MSRRGYWSFAAITLTIFALFLIAFEVKPNSVAIGMPASAGPCGNNAPPQADTPSPSPISSGPYAAPAITNTPSVAPSGGPTPTDTGTPIPISSQVPSTQGVQPVAQTLDLPSDTPAVSPSDTAIASDTPSPPPSDLPTDTPASSSVLTDSPAPTQTDSPNPTDTVIPTPTDTASPTPTDVVTPTPAASEVPTTTPSPTQTPSQTTIDPQVGGTATDSTGSIEVQFPPGAVSEPILVSAARLYGCDQYPASREVNSEFRLEATAVDGGASVTQFSNSVHLTVTPALAETLGYNLASTRLYYLNQADGSWIEVPSQVDAVTGVLTADLQHFSIYSTQSNPDVLLPADLRTFQVDMQSGAATTSIPLDLPTGPGGFVPQLSLSYSSSSANEMKTNRTMASWVGAGWSLSTPMVVKDPYAKAPLAPPELAGRYYLSMNGLFDLLIRENSQLSGQPGWYRFHTKDDNFLYIKGYLCGSSVETYYDFVVRTKDGTQYEFSKAPGEAHCTGTDGLNFFSDYRYDSVGCQCSRYVHIPYRMNVKRITDARGNYADYSYWEDIHLDCYVDPSCNTNYDAYDRAAYPSVIQWGANSTAGTGHLYEVVFNGGDFNGSNPSVGGWDEDYPGAAAVGRVRYDAPIDFNNNTCQPLVMETRRLTKAEVIQISSGIVIREFVPTYNHDTRTDPLGSTGCAVSGNYSLASWAQIGLNETNTLLTRGFAYETRPIRYRTASYVDCTNPNQNAVSRPYLSTATNGLGAQTTYAYTWQWGAIDSGCGWDRSVVDTLTTTPGAGQPAQTRKYGYSAQGIIYGVLYGLTSPLDAEYWGFNYVEECYGSSCSGTDRYECDYMTSEYEVGLASECRWYEGGSQLVKKERDFYSLLDVCSSACNNWEPGFDSFTKSKFVQHDRTDNFLTGQEPNGSGFEAVEYTYDPTYGNLTDVCTYQVPNDNFGINQVCGVGTTAGWYEHTKYTYYPNTSAWIVDLPAEVDKYSYVYGSASGSLLTSTLNYYDQTANYWTSPSKGLVDRVQQENNSGVYVNTAEYSYDNGYNTYGNKTSQVSYQSDATSFTTNYTYGCYNTTLSQTTDATTGQATTVSNNCLFQKPETTTDPNGQTDNIVYDQYGRTDHEWLPADSSSSPTVTYVYAAFNGSAPNEVDVTRREVAGGATRQETRCYDGLGRLVQTREQNSSGASITDTKYGSEGYKVSDSVTYSGSGLSCAALGSGNHYQYTNDVLGRITRTDNPDTGFSTVVYSDDQTVKTDPMGNRTVEIRDDLGRLIEVDEMQRYPNNGAYYISARTFYTYDALNRQTGISQPGNANTTTSYSRIGGKASQQTPDATSSRTYTYYDNGLMSFQTDPRGVMISFSYDSLNRITSKSYSCTQDPGPCAGGTAPTITYTYDTQPPTGMCPTITGTNAIDNCQQKGRLTTVTDWAGEHDYSYDARGRRTMSRDVIAGTTYDTSHRYDSLDRVTSLTYPVDGDIVSYTYDSGGQQATATSSLSGTLVSASVHNFAGEPTSYSLGTGSSLTFSYANPELRLTSWGGTSLDTTTLTYDPVGNVHTIQDALGTTTYTYDERNRLTSVGGTNSPYAATYTYDPLGNMTQKSENPALGPAETACTDAVDTDNDGKVNDGCTTSYSSITPASGKPDLVGTATGNNPAFTCNVAACTPSGDPVGHFTAQYSYDANGDAYQISAPAPGAPTGSDPELGLLFDAKNPVTTQKYDAEGRLAWIDYNKIDQSATGQGAGLIFYDEGKDGGRSVGPDCVVNLTDIFYISAYLNFAVGSPGYYSEYDVNKDGAVNLTDVFKLVPILNTSCPHFIYDYQGNLTRIDGGGGPYDNTFIGGIYEVAAVSAGVTKYYEFDGRRIAMNAAGTVSYLAQDAHGNTAYVLGSTGAVLSHTRYSPFGQTWTQEPTNSSSPTNKLFDGYTKDGTSSGLYYADARFYSADLGRFLSPDPVGGSLANPQSLNPYAYVRNNPLTLSDPSGACVPDMPVGLHEGVRGCGLEQSAGSLIDSIVGQRDPNAWDSSSPCFPDKCTAQHDSWWTNTLWAADLLRNVGRDLNTVPWSQAQREGLWDIYNIRPWVYDSEGQQNALKWLLVGGAGGASVAFATPSGVLQNAFRIAFSNPARSQDWSFNVDRIARGRGPYSDYMDIRGVASYQGNLAPFAAKVEGDPLSGWTNFNVSETHLYLMWQEWFR